MRSQADDASVGRRRYNGGSPFVCVFDAGVGGPEVARHEDSGSSRWPWVMADVFGGWFGATGVGGGAGAAAFTGAGAGVASGRGWGRYHLLALPAMAWSK
jgi:hypothetical protein